MRSNQILDQDTSEDKIAQWIDTVKQSPNSRDSLVELLPEQISLYIGRSANETIRIRGYILAAFEHAGLPDAAIPYVLEELENGRDAFLVAAAAKSLRGLTKPTVQIIPFLFKAVENIKYMDDAVTFESYKPHWPSANYTTALKEIFETFRWLGSVAHSAISGLEALYEDQNNFSETIRIEIKNAVNGIRAGRKDIGTSCCAIPISQSLPIKYSHNKNQDTDFLTHIEFEDQDGKTIKYGDFFTRVPSIVVFFYSRCNNPNKCSLTITKLARLQLAIREQGLEGQLKTAAITYDPQYDLPPRLKAYGGNRGVLFGNNDRFLRTKNGFKELQNIFQLGVNFNSSIVNRHRIELFILDDKSKIVATFVRLQWNLDEVLDSAKELLKSSCNSQETYQRHCCDVQ
jgi:protein SCO1/2